MKNLKKWLSTIITILLLVVLFGVIFVPLDFVEVTDPKFYIELALVSVLLIIIKITWYDNVEEARLNESDIKDAKEAYDDMVEREVTDVNDFENFLPELDEENQTKLVTYLMGKKTPESLGKIKYNKLVRRYRREAYKLFPVTVENYKEARKNYIEDKLDGRTAASLGQEKYDKLYKKARDKADKIPLLVATEILTRGESGKPYDSKNYTNKKKRKWQLISTITSIGISIGLASLAYNQITMNWESVFRYITYVYSIGQAIVLTVIQARKNTYNETMSHLERLSVIIKKYSCKKKGGKINGNIDSSRVVKTVERDIVL